MRKINKKGVEITMSTIIIFIIVLITMLVVLGILYKFTGEGKKETEGIFGNLRTDCDGDGIKNIIDACPCVAGEDTAGCEKDASKCSGCTIK
ncbi:hypothetical protein COV93_03135 [Candidatus Woesearchaeota archaeon CG11_big_fil_rev_8_21_14_0_20_43_8]|nr:MAG: hypothetical protein COV93_03135 [Candidatus Woesearchaeota archaeon CG11_big_fil_rev_8_21_14_0_20_43_8]PIO05146.1 MAG: hypothetical protein COT47_06060 [Candidatus Woesearchaeota archaeon CG08_land_8_20_14_0_20_43_7]